MRRRSVPLALAPVLLAACLTSPTLSGFPPARSASGVEARLRVGGQEIRGELLEASDSGFVVRQSPQIVFVPISVVRSARFAGIGHVTVNPPDADRLLTVRHSSRFPAGIPRSVLPELLRQSGQREIAVVRE